MIFSFLQMYTNSQKVRRLFGNPLSLEKRQKKKQKTKKILTLMGCFIVENTMYMY
jgi:hypothetical protein